MSERFVQGISLSEAWVGAIAAVVGLPGHKAFHLAVRISNPTEEVASIRGAVDSWLEDAGYPSVETVANTLFPRSMAERSEGMADLTERYRNLYPTIRRFPGNHHGTYFGRLVEFPSAQGPVDQLARVLAKLQAQLAGQHYSSVYEVNVHAAGDEIPQPEVVAEHVDVFDDGLDGKLLRGFPCLSSCAFHLEAQERRLHLVALYRNEFLVQKGYGNYLGLARLLQFMADQSNTSVGELLVIAGHAELDGHIRRARQVIALDESRSEDEEG